MENILNLAINVFNVLNAKKQEHAILKKARKVAKSGDQTSPVAYQEQVMPTMTRYKASAQNFITYYNDLPVRAIKGI